MEVRVETGTSDAVWRKFLLPLLEPIIWQDTTVCYLRLLHCFGSPVHEVHSDNIKKQFLPIGLRRTGPSFDTVSERESWRSCGMGCWRAGAQGFPKFRMNHYPSGSEVCMGHFCLEVESNSLLRNFYNHFRLSERHVALSTLWHQKFSYWLFLRVIGVDPVTSDWVAVVKAATCICCQSLVPCKLSVTLLQKGDHSHVLHCCRFLSQFWAGNRNTPSATALMHFA
jgi:hypothetical protein